MFIVLMLTFLQRQLMYVPSHAASLPVSLAGVPAAQGEDISLKTADGLTLHGWHLLPRGLTANNPAEFDQHLAEGPYYVVLFFHGNGGHREHRGMDYRILNSLSVHVMAFDYRGYGENKGSPSEANFAADAQAMWKYVTDTRKVPPERVLIYGESLGGGVATRLAAELCRAKTPPGGLILCSTFSSMVDAASYHYPWLPVRWVLVDRYRSDLRIGDVTAPILILHGARDIIVPQKLGRRLFDLAPPISASGTAKTFIDLPRANHNDILLTEENRYRQGLAKFLQTVKK